MTTLCAPTNKPSRPKYVAPLPFPLLLLASVVINGARCDYIIIKKMQAARASTGDRTIKYKRDPIASSLTG